MCHKIITGLECVMCSQEKGDVYCACVGEDGRAFDCDDYLAPDDCDIVLTKTCGATEVTFLCGWCVWYIRSGDAEEEISARPSMAEIRTRYETPLCMMDYMIDVIIEHPFSLAEDCATCGYRDIEGNIIMVIASLELAGIDRTTIVYSGPRKRRAVDW